MRTRATLWTTTASPSKTSAIKISDGTNNSYNRYKPTCGSINGGCKAR
jgi:hypothetical protein